MYQLAKPFEKSNYATLRLALNLPPSYRSHRLADAGLGCSKNLMMSNKPFSPPLQKQEEGSHKKRGAVPQRQEDEPFCGKVLTRAHPRVLSGRAAQDMGARRNGAGRVGARACLLLLLCLWPQQTLATPCQDGELRTVGQGERKCCPKCRSAAGKGMMRPSSSCWSVLPSVSQGNQVGERCVCKCILGGWICKTNRQGLPSCPLNSQRASAVNFRVDSWFGFVMCLDLLFCSGKGKAEFLWLSLAHNERRCSLNTDSEPQLCSNTVSEVARALGTSGGTRAAMPSVRTPFAVVLRSLLSRRAGSIALEVLCSAELCLPQRSVSNRASSASSSPSDPRPCLSCGRRRRGSGFP